MKLKGKTIFNIIFIISLLIMPIVFIKGYDKAEELIDYIVSDRAYRVAKDMNTLALSNSILYNEDEPIVVFDKTVDQKTQDEIYASLKQEAQYYFNEYSSDPNLYYTYRNGSVTINSHDKKPFDEDYFTGKITYKAGKLNLSSELEEYQNYISDNNYIIYRIMNQYDINGHYTIQYPDDMSMLEFSEQFGDIYVDYLRDRERESRKNLTQLYDRNGYNQLIQMHRNSNNYFSTVFQGGSPNREVNIDDMEVKLPSHMQNEYQARRQAFLNAILNK